MYFVKVFAIHNANAIYQLAG